MMLKLKFPRDLFLFFFVYLTLSIIMFIGVKKHDIRIKPKSYKVELLGELVVQHGIRA